VETTTISVVSGSRQCKLGMDVRLGAGPAMRAAGTAGLGAGAKGLVDDGLEGARAPAAFGAAAEAAIDLFGISGQILRGADGTADIVIGQDITGTDNHKSRRPNEKTEPIDI
jgi:hypothetical protein